MFSTQTLARRLLYTMFPWYLLLALSMTGVQLAIQYFTVNRAIVHDLNSLGRTVGPTVTDAVWELDRPRLAAMAHGFRQHAIVTGIRIENAKGDTLVTDGALPPTPGDIGNLLPTRHKQEVVALIYQPAKGGQRLIGYLKMYSGPNVIWERIKYSLFIVLLNSIIVTSGLWLIFSWTIRFRLSDAVTRIARTVAGWQYQTVATPAEKIAYPYRDELGALVAALNDSRERQFDSMQKLSEVNLNLEESVAERTQQLQLAKNAAEAASRAKGSFLANMSHEIRTPMNAIMGLTHLVLEGELGDKQRDYLEKVQTSSTALLALLNDILDYSKIEAGRMDLERSEFQLENCLRNVSDLFVGRLGEKGLALLVEIDPEVPRWVIGDALRLEQVLNNLLGNAIKFTETGEIHVRVAVVEQCDQDCLLQFAVKDTGIGMEAAHLQRLFQAFSQADTSITRKFGGTGLGLAICRHLVQLMGGEISAVSVPGGGSTFSFTCRFAQAVAPAERLHIQPSAPGSNHLGPRETLAQIRGAHILLVEDNTLNQEVAREFLSKAGLSVTVAGNGQEAVDLIKQQRFDAVLMDLHMPVLDGLQATRLIRALPQGQDLPILAMTAAAMPQDRIASVAAGMNGHIAKPVDPQELASRLVEWIKPRSPIVPQGTVESDTDKNDVLALALALPHVAVRPALVRLHGNTGLYRELLAAFCTRHAHTAGNLLHLLEKSDYTALLQIAHELKGEAGNLGLSAVQAAADELGHSIRDRQFHEAAALAPQLALHCTQAIADIGALAPAMERAAAAGTADLVEATLLPLLGTLQQQLRARHFAAIQTLGKIRPLLAGTHLAGPFKNVAKLTETLNFDGALATLKTLMHEHGWE